MVSEILTIVLAPASMVLLGLYLQQLAEVRRIRHEKESLLGQLAEAKKQITGDAATHKEALRSAEEKHKAEIERREKKIEECRLQLKSCHRVLSGKNLLGFLEYDISWSARE